MPEKRVVILQSNYIPWKGYFDLLASADLFIFYDDVQYTHDDWRNRNKIITKDGLKWLTIPVGRSIKRKVNEVVFDSQDWKQKHFQIIQNSYKECPYYDEALLNSIYNNPITNLSEFNQNAISKIAEYVGINTPFERVENYQLEGNKTERLIHLLNQVKAAEYISGPSAKDYLNESLFEMNGIQLTYFDYADYPIYNQNSTKFEHGVTILDLIFNVGDKTKDYLLKG